MIRLPFAVACVLTACSSGEPPQHYRFVARLGRDTISVDNVTRQNRHVVIDGVDRFPRVRRRHRDTVHGTIGEAAFTIDYSRPLLRGRILFGDIIPYDRVWRTGANAATQLTTSAPIPLAE